MKISLKQLLLFALILVSTASYSQGQLSKSKEEVKENSKESSWNRPVSESNSSASNNNNSGKSGFIRFLGQVIYYSTFYVAIGSYGTEEHLYNDLSKYPYNVPNLGNYVAEPSEANPGNKYRFDISDNLLASNDIYGNHLKAKIRPWKFFYLQGDYITLVEPSDRSDGLSTLSIFNFNLNYDRLRFERFNIGWTMGATYLASGVNKAGFNIGVNLEVFFPANISLYSSLIGSFVNGIPVDQLEANLRYHKNRFFVSGGYEAIRISSEDFHFAAFGLGVYL
jgi:hypothetical protein